MYTHPRPWPLRPAAPERRINGRSRRLRIVSKARAVAAPASQQESPHRTLGLYNMHMHMHMHTHMRMG